MRARVFEETANHHRSRNETEPAPATRHGRHNRLGHCVRSVAQTAPNRPVSAGISRRPPTAHLACQSHFCASFASSFSFLRSERSQVRILPGALRKALLTRAFLVPLFSGYNGGLGPTHGSEAQNLARSARRRRAAPWAARQRRCECRRSPATSPTPPALRL